jgi:hypothetical protein
MPTLSISIECNMLSVIVLSVIKLNVIMLNFIMPKLYLQSCAFTAKLKLKKICFCNHFVCHFFALVLGQIRTSELLAISTRSQVINQ